MNIPSLLHSKIIRSIPSVGPILVFALALIISSWNSHLKYVTAQTSTANTNAVSSSVVTWSYANQEQWVTNYPECGGSLQSPINLSSSQATVKPSGYLKVWAPLVPNPVMGLLLADEHFIRLDLSSYQIQVVGSVSENINLLQEVHFHSPAEHTLNGIRYPLELHYLCVPVDYQQRIANGETRYPITVVALLVDADDQAPIFNLLTQVSANVAGVSATTTVNVSVDPALILPNTFYVYHGSLTTPPCNEIVRFCVSSQPVKASLQSIQAIVDATARISGSTLGNARDLQNVNGRTVELRSFFSTD